MTKYLPRLGEIQLHSVAGWAEDPRVLQQRRKLPVLMAALFETIDERYPQKEQYGVARQSTIEYQGVDILTFSAYGKVVSLYEELGFERSSRAGILISPSSA